MYSCDSYQSLSIRLFLLFSGLVLIKLVSSSQDELFYVTPTQPPNPECPQNASCQTLQYYLDNSKHYGDFVTMNSSSKVTLLFLNGNHIVATCLCTRLIYFSPYLSMIGLSRSVVIDNMDVGLYASQLTIHNIVFRNGAVHTPTVRDFTLSLH